MHSSYAKVSTAHTIHTRRHDSEENTVNIGIQCDTAFKFLVFYCVSRVSLHKDTQLNMIFFSTSWAFVFPTAEMRSEKSCSSVAMTLVVMLYWDMTYGTSLSVTCLSNSSSIITVGSLTLSIS